MIANWVIGVLLATVASIVSNLGLNLQKLNHTLNEQRIRSQLREERRRASGRGESASVSQGGVAGLSSGTEFGSTGSKILHESAEMSSYQNNNSNQQGNSYSSISPPSGEMDMTSSQRIVHELFPSEQPELVKKNSLNSKPSYPSAIPAAVQDQREQQQQQHAYPHQIAAQHNIEAYQKLQRVEYTRQTMWRAGLGLVVLGSMLDFAALIFAAQSIVAPLGSLTLVSNTVFAPLLLGETISQRDLLATFAIVIGSGLSVIFADHQDAIYPVAELFSFFATPRFLLYSLVILLALGILFYWKRYLTYLKLTQPRRYNENGMAQYHRFTYAALAGIMGAQSVLFAKCTGEILVNTLVGRSSFMFLYWQTYGILAGMFITIYFQISWLNSGLKLFEALYIVPVFQSFWILVSVVAGMIFFGEYKEVFNAPESSVFFPLGVVITIAGVYFLSQRGGGGPNKNQESNSAKGTPQQRNYRHYRANRDGSTTSDYDRRHLLGEPPSYHDDISSIQAEEDAVLFTQYTDASPAPPIGFMSGPFLTTQYAPHANEATGDEFIDENDLESGDPEAHTGSQWHDSPSGLDDAQQSAHQHYQQSDATSQLNYAAASTAANARIQDSIDVDDIVDESVASIDPTAAAAKSNKKGKKGKR